MLLGVGLAFWCGVRIARIADLRAADERDRAWIERVERHRADLSRFSFEATTGGGAKPDAALATRLARALASDGPLADVPPSLSSDDVARSRWSAASTALLTSVATLSAGPPAEGPSPEWRDAVREFGRRADSYRLGLGDATARVRDEIWDRADDLGAEWITVYVLAAVALLVVVAMGWLLFASERQRRALVASEAALRESERRYRQIFEGNRAIKLLIDPETASIVDANPAAAEFYGYPLETLKSMRITDINLEPPEQIRDAFARARTQQCHFVFPHRLASGEVRTVEVQTGPVELNGRTLFFSVIHDVTRQRSLEEHLRRSQRLESLGRLAGGIAHDFNNLLTAISGYTQLLEGKVPPGDARRAFVTEIRKATERASGLTGQLLAFSRRQVLAPVPLDLNVVVGDVQDMLRRLLGERVELVFDAASGLHAVRADPNQIVQILLNLTTNARDAMPEGGRLVIATANERVDPECAAKLGLPAAGDWARLSVSDTGQGMDPEAMAHAFEPFWTTKRQGVGNGLGLATVYGIVHQSGGSISLDSEIGKGTTVSIRLPRCEGPVPARSVTSPRTEAATGSETVLLAEDEPQIRDVLARVLREAGYAVLEAKDGEDAVRIAAGHSGPIHLLVTDVVMPRMDGGALAATLTTDDPHLKVIYMSGYVDDELVQRTAGRAGRAFLQKPFRPEELLKKAREILDAARSPAAV